ncbi:elongation of very long chain fatty acids protein 4-like [Pomacea canaliculata]|nr:elongation of very long chain fatty acids protein 4-like [Pomacea canaliculata]
MTLQAMNAEKEWYIMPKGDPHASDFPLMGGGESMAAVVVLYLLTATQGPRLMSMCKPFQLNLLLIVYNFFMVVLSVYMFTVGAYLTIATDHSFVCTTVEEAHSKGHSALMYRVAWLFVFSKILEMADTVFFILRKKFNQVTFLHVYHHSSMFVFSWVVFKYVPGGQFLVYPLFNSFVHIIMYTYYALAAMGPSVQKYLWWKRYLTMLQIAQFVILLAFTLVNIVAECDFPKGFSYAALVYGLTILLLFINFYRRSYSSKDKGQ